MHQIKSHGLIFESFYICQQDTIISVYLDQIERREQKQPYSKDSTSFKTFNEGADQKDNYESKPTNEGT